MVAPIVLWPDHHERALRSYVASRAGSFVQITALMNAQLGTSYTRNAIIGKSKRMKLASNNPPGKHVPSDNKPKRITVKPAKPAPNSPEAVQLRCVEVDPQNLTIYELTDETCHWPYGEVPPLTYCGHPIFCGSYCGAHFYLSTRSN